MGIKCFIAWIGQIWNFIFARLILEPFVASNWMGEKVLGVIDRELGVIGLAHSTRTYCSYTVRQMGEELGMIMVGLSQHEMHMRRK